MPFKFELNSLFPFDNQLDTSKFPNVGILFKLYIQDIPFFVVCLMYFLTVNRKIPEFVVIVVRDFIIVNANHVGA